VSKPPVTAAYFRALNERNITMFMNCFTTECEAHSPFGEPPYRGHAMLPQMLKQHMKLWRRFHVIPKSASRSGNRIAVVWMAEATAQCGSQSIFDGVSVFEVDDKGKIARLEEFWDRHCVPPKQELE
jgi:steroid Delta-isomerase